MYQNESLHICRKLYSGFFCIYSKEMSSVILAKTDYSMHLCWRQNTNELCCPAWSGTQLLFALKRELWTPREDNGTSKESGWKISYNIVFFSSETKMAKPKAAYSRNPNVYPIIWDFVNRYLGIKLRWATNFTNKAYALFKWRLPLYP